jgi:hypothetical protein
MRRFLVVLIMGVLAAGSAAAQSKDSAPCGRDCLEGMVNQYLAAMVEHNPSKAPFAKTFKLTENIAKLPPTEGLWLHASGIGDYKIYIADPKEGQIAFLGVVKELDKPRLLALRLKVEKRQITEVFKIKNGKIRDILAVMISTPYGLGDGWSPLPSSFRAH